MRISRLYIRSIPRRLKRLWLVMTFRAPYQCDGCLNWFTCDEVKMTPSPYCVNRDKGVTVRCGAPVCARCLANDNYNGPSCWCDL